jgi:hypothetical protein
MGVPQDDAKSVEWYLKAADQGYAKAQMALGVKYARGEGVPQDYVEASKWLSLAIASGARDAQRALEHFSIRMSRDQIAAGERSAESWRAAHIQNTAR